MKTGYNNWHWYVLIRKDNQHPLPPGGPTLKQARINAREFIAEEKKENEWYAQVREWEAAGWRIVPARCNGNVVGWYPYAPGAQTAPLLRERGRVYGFIEHHEAGGP